ncbi:uncharacterized protein LOC106167167 [Lingula anatina]|uniref:Uncharacterized protein LOC106167167 n=1 Tax=Lingula anatina TaxID=7574 RepID=A0A1S3ISZ2_LINAN|nr:uncharacterized protein LOC106167167 [Lingula anatina]|eukprot:XP_013401330.1 uncharacterized protein LOC106167167 [Lingula anatina]
MQVSLYVSFFLALILQLLNAYVLRDRGDALMPEAGLAREYENMAWGPPLNGFPTYRRQTYPSSTTWKRLIVPWNNFYSSFEREVSPDERAVWSPPPRQNLRSATMGLDVPWRTLCKSRGWCSSAFFQHQQIKRKLQLSRKCNFIQMELTRENHKLCNTFLYSGFFFKKG